MRVVVTGGAGFIGANLVIRLLQEGYEPVVFDDFSSGLHSNVDGLGAEVITGDVRDLDRLVAAVTGSDAVVHLAARGSVPRSIAFPLETHATNATGTLNVMEAARRAEAQVIFSSSSSVYGANQELPKNETMRTEPITPYAASKLAGESYARAYSESYGLKVTTFRFFNVFGPSQRPDHSYAAVIPRWIWHALHGDDVVVFGDGLTTRDFTFVEDVVSVLLRTVEMKASHAAPINLAYGARISLLDVIAHIEQFMQTQVAVIHEEPRQGDIQHSQNDPALLLSLFPDLSPTPFSAAFEATADWLRSFGERVANGPDVRD